jgi:hypothetical protein
MTFERNAIQRDYLAMLRLADAERARRQVARDRARANAELVDWLTAESHRRGDRGVIDWPEYFRNVDIGGADGAWVRS